jgi:anti-sigma-K factor RskA
MNAPPQNPRLLSELAAHYVLGTLRGAARRRLERWRARSPELDAQCGYWEEHLMPLLQGLKPLEPPSRVWQGIRLRLRLAQAAPARTPRRLAAWAAALLLAVGLGVVLYWSRVTPEKPVEVAVIVDPSGAPVWQVEVFGRADAERHLSVRTTARAKPPAGRTYELWALPKNGNPVSLGVLPQQEGASQRVLTQLQRDALSRSEKIAVSVEPEGGSPTGQPTGPVVFLAPLRGLS